MLETKTEEEEITELSALLHLGEQKRQLSRVDVINPLYAKLSVIESNRRKAERERQRKEANRERAEAERAAWAEYGRLTREREKAWEGMGVNEVKRVNGSSAKSIRQDEERWREVIDKERWAYIQKARSIVTAEKNYIPIKQSNEHLKLMRQQLHEERREREERAREKAEQVRARNASSAARVRDARVRRVSRRAVTSR